MADFIAHDLKLRMGITKQFVTHLCCWHTILVGIFAVTYILPRFSTLFANTRIDLPTPTRILLGINQFFTDYWQVAIFGIVFLVIAIWRILQTKSGRFQWHKILLDLPVFGPIAQKWQYLDSVMYLIL
ncbi:MAG: hypothetical protein CM15mL3_0010 [Kanaloavirus sp.]|nr:MAG: hypothetical protein CM15mL3_0010 [Kanaloavirus sp.]